MQNVATLNKNNEKKVPLKQNEEIELVNLEQKTEIPKKKNKEKVKSPKIAWENEKKNDKKGKNSM